MNEKKLNKLNREEPMKQWKCYSSKIILHIFCFIKSYVKNGSIFNQFNIVK